MTFTSRWNNTTQLAEIVRKGHFQNSKHYIIYVNQNENKYYKISL